MIRLLQAGTVLALAGCAAGADAGAPRFEVRTGQRERINTPLSAPLPASAPVPLQLYEQQPNGGTIPVPTQIEPGNPLKICWILTGATPWGSTRTFFLVAAKEQPRAQVTLHQDEHKLTIQLHAQPVLSFQYALLSPPPGASDRFMRSGFIHPLWSPSGIILSRIHPPDHIHHLGLWGPWTKTEFEGHPIDFWNLNQGEGTVRFERFLDKSEGPVFGGFAALQEHIWLQAPEGERVVLHETRTIRAWNTANKTGWPIDYISSYRCATDSPLLLQAYRYGGLGFRATEVWHNGNSDYLTSEGKTRTDADGTNARWCDVYGETPNGIEGVLFMSHPDNQAHPEPMRIWPTTANGGRGDIFFSFCPIRHADWKLEPGRAHVLRYRLYPHHGKLSAAEGERLWQDFAHPPEVEFLP